MDFRVYMPLDGGHVGCGIWQSRSLVWNSGSVDTRTALPFGVMYSVYQWNPFLSILNKSTKICLNTSLGDVLMLSLKGEKT